ncbi:MAG: LamG domain-containing protein [Paludibacter sp.]|nr:LamG domain-containing protein [Paludibacter sp.]
MKKLNFLGIFAVIALLFTGMVFTSCEEKEPDPYEGKTNPSTIASSNLIAYWGFENSPKDEIGQRGVATSAVTYPVGRRGNAFKGAEGAYISFDLPATDKLATLKTFTAAMWVKAPKVPAGKGIPVFFQLSGNGWEGALSIFQDNLGDNSADSIRMKGFFGKAGVPWAGQWWDKSNSSFLADRWFHFVINYDNATSIATIYVNGNAYKFETLSAYDSAVRYQNDPGSATNVNGAAKLGDLNLPLRETNNKGIIGYWAIKAFYGGTDDWQGYYTGTLDELRIYDRALTAAEVKALYDAEITVIN